MKNRLIAAVTAAALALGSTIATPAAAMSDKDRKTLTLLLGAAAVGLIISEANKKKHQEVPQTRFHGRDDDDYWNGQRRFDHHQERMRHRGLPPECVFSVRSPNGPREVVSARCAANYGFDRRLPDACAFDLSSRWRDGRVYGTQCLRRHGYGIADLR